MKKSDLNKERKRSDILRAAHDVFHSDGYLGASMDRIAEHAGVTKQTVYRYFNSKEVLFQASLETWRSERSNSFQEELERSDPYDALIHFAIGFLELHMSEVHLAGVRLLIAEGPTAPEMTRAYYAVGPRKTEECLVRFFKTHFRAEDPEYAVKMLLSTLLSMRMGVLVGLHPIPTQEELMRHAERTVAICIKQFVD
ncbi:MULTISPECIES: TetR/AcrR family transcriptional regulator [unclassified Pseudodesulfovibrio]|uniref:TetR/AcrR family transcriptional regulator n=1 Tax=unclassified Pseudodesulfovibrio TaxID=2661612 RepID=UPI000FEBE08B|nr:MULTISPECIES: TetR/AcrR family transcriptional regulator [unclassified Pseudodesulfovibrio]MCJ2162939.1 TetR/AcrR family transcriptional regulator [Pseudodesulfovibrio sp. S3-i]RWU06939.1 TetR/AcrR family transcriptional regulator [Pseudodesulfovibrio sp. S3]